MNNVCNNFQNYQYSKMYGITETIAAIDSHIPQRM